MKNVVNDLMNREMDRKEFFKFAGGAALILTGIAGVMKSLRSLRAGDGYGGGYFGKSDPTMEQILSGKGRK